MINIVESDNNYYIDSEGMIYLSKRKGDIRCEKCNNVLAIVGDKALLIRTTINVLDMNNNVLISRCGKCKHYNNINLTLLAGER